MQFLDTNQEQQVFTVRFWIITKNEITKEDIKESMTIGEHYGNWFVVMFFELRPCIVFDKFTYFLKLISGDLLFSFQQGDKFACHWQSRPSLTFLGSVRYCKANGRREDSPSVYN